MTPAELRTRRSDLGLTQAGLAEALGVAANTVARWERGEAPIGKPELVQLALERLDAGRSAQPDHGAPVGQGRATRSHTLPGELSSFIGREPEMRALESQFAGALAGRGGMAMLVGEPGIGKTWLARHFAGAARSQGGLVLWGRCFEGEGTPPYAPWVEVLDAYARLLEPDQLRRQLGSSAAPLARLVPGVRTALPHMLPAAPLSPAEERVRLYDAVTQALRAVSQEQALLVVLDDLHWADRDALGLLAYLGRFVVGMRLLLVGTYRDVEVDRHHPLIGVLGVLRHEVDYAHLPIHGLGYPELVEYLDQAAGRSVPDALAQRIYAETDGSPFYTRELLRHLEEHRILDAAMQSPAGISLVEEGVPEGVRQVIRQRIARLSEPTQRLLAVAAGFAGRFQFAAVKAVTGLDDEVLLECIDEALAAGLLQDVSSPGEVYDFAHALMRHTFYDELNASRKARLHRRIAEALERASSTGDLHDAAAVAAHYHASASLPGAEGGIAYAIAAAEQARQEYAREQAVHLLRMAQDLAEGTAAQTRADVLRRLALAEAEAGLLESAATTAHAALEVLAEAGIEGDTVAAFVATVARALKEGGASHLVWEPLVRRGLGLVGDRQDLTAARLLLLQDHFEVVSSGLINAARWTGHHAQAVAIARASGEEDDYARSLEPLEWRSRAETEAILALARTWSRPAAILHALNVGARDLLYRHGAYREAAECYHELLEASTRYGSVPGQAEALAQLSACVRALGELAESQRMLQQARETVVRLGTYHRLQFVVETGLTIGLAYYIGGDWPDLARSAIRFMSSPRAVRSPLGLMAAAFAALACVRAGKHAEAHRILATLMPVLDHMQAKDYNHNYVVDNAGTSIWELSLHEFAASARQLALDLIEAGVGGGPNNSHELTVARMAGLLGDVPEAETYFARARVMLTALGQRPLVAIANHDEALMRLRLKLPHRVGTTLSLDAALAEFHELGMEEWAHRTRVLAESVTAPKPDANAGDTELAMLTQREREVAGLVGAGHTNRSIAAKLVITEGTAERHVSNIFGKLGLGSRSRLAVWAAEHRLLAKR